MTSLERSLTLRRFLIARYSLLSKADRLDLTTLFSHDDVRLGGMTRSSFGLVEASNSCSL